VDLCFVNKNTRGLRSTREKEGGSKPLYLLKFEGKARGPGESNFLFPMPSLPGEALVNKKSSLQEEDWCRAGVPDLVSFRNLTCLLHPLAVDFHVRRAWSTNRVFVEECQVDVVDGAVTLFG
jgi:hypothetical protein